MRGGMRQSRGELKKTVLMLAAGLLASTMVCAQSTGPRDLAELKQETQRRADRSLPPVSGVRPDDVREAMSNLNSLEPDAWAAAFSRIGDREKELGLVAVRTRSGEDLGTMTPDAFAAKLRSEFTPVA